MYRSPLKTLLSFFRTILHVQQPVRVIKNINRKKTYNEFTCLTIFLILLALLLHPFLNITSYLLIMPCNGVGLGASHNYLV